MKEGGVACVLAAVCIFLVQGRDVGLSLTKECGETSCQMYQYCSDKICYNCSRICMQNNRNFDQATCESSCQDYIHDEVRRYITKAESYKIIKDLQETIENLRKMVATSTSLAIISFMGLLLVVGFSWWRRYKGRHPLSKKKMTVATICNNNEKDPSIPAAPPSQGSFIGAPSVATTTTPLTTRHPSEDTTLEHAYYNHALTPSPEHSNRNETTF